MHWEQARRYFRLALHYAVAGSKPLVLVVMGRIASGKSTLAKLLPSQAVIEVDGERRTVDVTTLSIGVIMLVSAGDRIAAGPPLSHVVKDARAAEQRRLHIDRDDHRLRPVSIGDL